MQSNHSHRIGLDDDDENLQCFLQTLKDQLEEESARKMTRYNLDFPTWDEDAFYDDRAVSTARTIDILKVKTTSLLDLLNRGPSNDLN